MTTWGVYALGMVVMLPILAGLAGGVGIALWFALAAAMAVGAARDFLRERQTGAAFREIARREFGEFGEDPDDDGTAGV